MGCVLAVQGPVWTSRVVNFTPICVLLVAHSKSYITRSHLFDQVLADEL